MTLTVLADTRYIGGNPWKELKMELVSSYREAHVIKNPKAFDMFLSRCRKLREMRNIGLKYVIFCPTLASQVEQIGPDDWERWKTLLTQREVASEVDKMIERHCPRWFEVLKEMYPRWNMGSLRNGQPNTFSHETNATAYRPSPPQ